MVDAQPPVLPNYAGAIRAFGTPTSCSFLHGIRGVSIVRWEKLGVTAEFTTLGAPPNGGEACSEPAAFQLDHLIITGEGWRTSNGLTIGDPASKVPVVYSKALPHGSSWWILIRKNVIGSTYLYPVFSADVSRGHIASFKFHIGAEDD